MIKFLVFLFSLLVVLNFYSQTPPVLYVSSDGSGDFDCNGTSDQVEINLALDYIATNSNFTTVYLKAGNAYVIDEPIEIASNTILTGDSLAVVRLKDSVAWWTFDKPMLTQKNRLSWDPYGEPSE